MNSVFGAGANSFIAHTSAWNTASILYNNADHASNRSAISDAHAGIRTTGMDRVRFFAMIRGSFHSLWAFSAIVSPLYPTARFGLMIKHSKINEGKYHELHNKV